jgi:hypothetical protein
MIATLGENDLSYTSLKRWVVESNCGRKSLEDNPVIGLPLGKSRNV